MPTAGQSGPGRESAGNGGSVRSRPVAQQVWDAHYRSGQRDYPDSAGQAALHLAICELYQRYSGDGTVLDIGCGNGNLYRYLTEHAGMDTSCYTGIDVAEEAVRQAAAQFPEAGFGQRDYGTESVGSRFDCVIFNESLQCFEDPIAILEKCMDRNMHACSLLIVAMSGDQNESLWGALEERFGMVDEHLAQDHDGSPWKIRALKPDC
jgi:2-polyprenyl-6-hydroxyphenyl methylase/3-demethylubiquinone-9 3-methyltransferase